MIIAINEMRWVPRGDGLGEDEDVGLDAGELRGKVLAGPAESGLDFVVDEEDAVLVADLPEALHERLGRLHVASLTLHRFLEKRKRKKIRTNTNKK